jgi:glucose-1-phosphate thymidylyltransferase
MTKLKSGILLAGGVGSRLSPATKVFNKHLYPVGNKLVIDYSLNTAQHLGIENLIITLGGEHFSGVVDYVGDGKEWGLNVSFLFQPKADGIASAINLCQPFLKEDQFAVILGDNVFQKPIKYNRNFRGAQIFLNRSSHLNLMDFGVATLQNENLLRIEEKPKVINEELENYAITGCYIFDHQYFDYFAQNKPSARGEWEVADIINQYWKDDQLDWAAQDGWWSDLGKLDGIDKVRELMKIEPIEWYQQ